MSGFLMPRTEPASKRCLLSDDLKDPPDTGLVLFPTYNGLDCCSVPFHFQSSHNILTFCSDSPKLCTCVCVCVFVVGS